LKVETLHELHSITVNLNRPVVLIVDDTPANLAYLSDALDEGGYKVLVALDGQTALERLRLIKPDVILLDAVMPGIDGFETCRLIKASQDTRDIPVIFMTALVDTQHVVRGFDAGAVDYVTKPVRQEEVLARIATHIKRSRSLQKAQCSIDAFGKAGMTVDERGAITWQTQHAEQWLDEYCNRDTHPNEWKRLQHWINVMVSGKQSMPTQITFSINANRLCIHYGGIISGSDHLLLLEEQRVDFAAKRMTDEWHLTAREAEVICWLTAGKTNRDIAEILNMSPRTVNKHLEHIYVKLGVETRAAAVAIAFKAMAPQMAAR
jgi:DNA-binding response OmpR family regulator